MLFSVSFISVIASSIKADINGLNGSVVGIVVLYCVKSVILFLEADSIYDGSV